MSGIYIQGMEMPTSCIACRLNYGEKRPEHGLTIYCPFSNGVIPWRDQPFNSGHLSSCGIVPVPEHGDLIDRDALLESEPEYFIPNYNSDGYLADGEGAYTSVQIEDAPTVIPADKEET